MLQKVGTLQRQQPVRNWKQQARKQSRTGGWARATACRSPASVSAIPCRTNRKQAGAAPASWDAGSRAPRGIRHILSTCVPQSITIDLSLANRGTHGRFQQPPVAPRCEEGASDARRERALPVTARSSEPARTGTSRPRFRLTTRAGRLDATSARSRRGCAAPRAKCRPAIPISSPLRPAGVPVVGLFSKSSLNLSPCESLSAREELVRFLICTQ